MKLFLKSVCFLFLTLILTPETFAQVYPVQLNPIFNTPYSSKLSDYSTSFDEKIRLIVNPTDINISNRQVRLKMYLQGNGINAQSAAFVQGANPIFINGGELLTLTNLDFGALFQLQNLDGLTAVQYANPLPDGIYTICFEMYDFITNKQLSKKSCTSLYFQLNDPPLLNIPTKNEQIAVTNFPNILFTWTPRQINATNVSYKYELKEILDPSIDPQFAFTVSPLIYEESLFSTALLYDLSKPTLIPGKTYAWRVKAISTSGLSENNVFKNQGYSEIFWFKYLANCPAPSYLLSESQTTTRVKLTWQGNPENVKYHVQYKKHNIPNAEWFSLYTLNTQTTISDLEAGLTYDFRVGATCDPLSSATLSYIYSGINQFTMPAAAPTNSAYNCGINPTIAISNQTPITNLIVNETFTAGDFPVTILEISGNGTYTGKGFIIVPYLEDTKIAVEFNGITVNTNYQLINGIVETSYNPNWTNVSDVEDLTDTGDVTITQVPFVVTSVTINGAGDIVISGANGQQITVPGGGNVQIEDSAGNVYTVDENGNVTGPMQQAAGGAPTPTNTDGVNASGQATSISAEGVLVTFEKASSNVYGFDSVASNADAKVKKLYKSLNASYYMPYKSVLNTADGGVDDFIIAKIGITNDTIASEKIVFKTEKGIKIESTKISDTEYKLTLKGSFKNTELDILATIKQGDKYKVAGAFKLLYLAKRTTAKVILVNTDNANIPNKANLQNYLNGIYKVAGASFEVIETLNLNIDDKLADVSKISCDESGLAANYNAEMQAINSAIKNTPLYNQHKDAYYLIITNKTPTKANEKGFMPLGRKFGYIFSGESHTIAHELGHGIFQIKHPFSTTGYNIPQGSTNWLMDYVDTDVLPHTHWKNIQNPGWRIGLFDGDSEGESQWTDIEDKFLNLDNTSFTFLSFNAQLISLNKLNLIRVLFNFGNSTEHNQPLGVLQDFEIFENNKVVGYSINFTDGNYYNENNIAYDFPIVDETKIDGVIFYLPCEAEGYIHKFEKGNLGVYTTSTAKSGFVEMDLFPFVPYSNNHKILIKEGNELTQVFKVSDEGKIWSYDQNTNLMTTNYCGKSELFYILKIAQLRKFYPESFERFTKPDDWEKPLSIISSVPKWEMYLLQHPEIRAFYETNKVAFFKEMLSVYRNYILDEIQESIFFWEELTAITSKTQTEVAYRINRDATVKLKEISITKKNLALEILLNGSLPENRENAVLKLISCYKDTEQNSLKNKLLNDIGLSVLAQKFDDYFGEDNFTKMFTFLGGISEIKDATDEQSKDAANLINIIQIDNSIFGNKSTDATISGSEIDFSSASYTYSSNGSQNYQSRPLLKVPYNQEVFVRFESNFQFNGVNYKNGDFTKFPAIVVYAMINNANTQQIEKTSWLVFDGVMFAIGVGEIKILFTAGNYLRKALIVGDLVGSGLNLALDAGLEEKLPPELAQKFRIVGLLLSAPMGIKALKDLGTNYVTQLRQAKNTPNLTVAEKQLIENKVLLLESKVNGVGSFATHVDIQASLSTIASLKNTNKLTKAIGSTSDVELAAIHKYTEDGGILNTPMRNGSETVIDAVTFTPFQSQVYQSIKTGLTKLRQTNRLVTGTVIRGRTYSLADFNTLFASGSANVPLKGLVSCTKNEAVAIDFLTKSGASVSGSKVKVIMKIKSKNGVDIDDMSDWGTNLVNQRHPGNLVQEEVLLEEGMFKMIGQPVLIKTEGGIPWYEVNLEELGTALRTIN